jgi:hypothetical protein
MLDTRALNPLLLGAMGREVVMEIARATILSLLVVGSLSVRSLRWNFRYPMGQTADMLGLL